MIKVWMLVLFTSNGGFSIGDFTTREECWAVADQVGADRTSPKEPITRAECVRVTRYVSEPKQK